LTRKRTRTVFFNFSISWFNNWVRFSLFDSILEISFCSACLEKLIFCSSRNLAASSIFCFFSLIADSLVSSIDYLLEFFKLKIKAGNRNLKKIKNILVFSLRPFAAWFGCPHWSNFWLVYCEESVWPV
jgi:hypothetical protein